MSDEMIRHLPPIAVSRDEAAQMLGIGVTKFDEMVSSGRMPEGRHIDTRVLWSVEEIIQAFHALPRRGQMRGNDPWADLTCPRSSFRTSRPSMRGARPTGISATAGAGRD
jgi:predicted DNA-binding transcriptional regulator AlpA